MSNIKLSTSLFSYALEWQSRQYSFEDLLAKTKSFALGNGLEIVGFQSIKNFLNVSNQEISVMKSLIEKYEFVPACLGSNTDIGIKRNYKMTIDEVVDYLKPQIEVAAKLDFPVIRIQMTTPLEALEKLLPFAEKNKVKMGVELHTPYFVDFPAVLQLRELYAKLDSEYLGFIPDFGTSMRAIPDALLNSFKAVGVTDEAIEITKDIWKKDIPTPAKFGELQQRVSAIGGTAAQIGRLNMAFSMNGRQAVNKWAEIVPQTVHLHGKFYGFDENGDEPSIDYAAILKVFHDGGFEGYLTSEYEGTAFTDEFTGFEMVQKHHELCRKILDKLN